MANSVATPLEKQFSTIAGITSISSQQQPGQHEHHPAVRLEPRHRLGGAGRPVDDRAHLALAAAGHAVAAVVPEGQPGRPAGAVPDPELADDAAVAGRPVRGDRARAAAVDGQRRGRRQRLRRAEIRGPHRRRPDPARGAPDRHRPGRQRDRRRERQPPDRHALRPAAQLRRPDERPADGRRGLPADRRSPTGTAARSVSSEVANVYDGVENPRNASWYNGTPRHLPRPSQRQPGTNTVEVVDAIKALLPQLQAQLPAVARSGHPQRPLGLDSRVGRGRQVHAGPDGRPRRPRDLPVPAQPLRDDHPQPRAAVLDRRHVRGDVGCSTTASTTCR